MFMAANEGCVFNSLKITDQRQYLADNQIPIRNLYFYRDEATQLAKWRDANKGDEMYWSIVKLPPSGETNKFYYDSSIKKPARSTSGVIGVDGYSNEQGEESMDQRLVGLCTLNMI